jgi:hypothetical protein
VKFASQLSLIIFVLFSQLSHSQIVTLNNSQVFKQKNGLTRAYRIEGQYDESNQSTALYRIHYKQANPFVPSPFVTIAEEIKKNNQLITKGSYHTGELGLRITPDQFPGSTEHFIISGDSNVFGIGVEDNETLPYFLSKNSKKFALNFGLAGSGPSNTLYFLEHFNLSSIVKNKMKGLFLYDFQPYLFERVIGSKKFLQSNLESPRYEFIDGKIKYLGDFKTSWVAIFYSFLNKLPYTDLFFPNLPQINHRHIELTAKVLAEIKNDYLKQTLSTNRFVVSINPTYKKPYKKELSYFIECLAKEKIEIITFDDLPKFHLARFKDEGHYTKEAHQRYAEILWKKLESGR